MERRDANFPPVLLVRCRLAVRNFVSVFYIVPKIWFGVDGNSETTSKKYIYMSTTHKENSQ